MRKSTKSTTRSANGNNGTNSITALTALRPGLRVDAVLTRPEYVDPETSTFDFRLVMVDVRDGHMLDATNSIELDDGRFAVPMALFRVCQSEARFEDGPMAAFSGKDVPPPGEVLHREHVKKQLERLVEAERERRGAP
jgi:hypothetical protein